MKLTPSNSGADSSRGSTQQWESAEKHTVTLKSCVNADDNLVK